MAIADKHLREGGRMAFILPAALATGEAWGASRKLLADRYHLEKVILSHDAGRPNFSENTDLSEIMFIARKLKRNEKPGSTSYINLWHNPRTIYEALDIADRVSECLDEGLDAAATVRGADNRKLAEIVQLPPSQGQAQWIGAQYAQWQTLHAAMSLGQGVLDVPGQEPISIRMCALNQIGALGPDRKRIHEGFTVSKDDFSPYPSFWNHDSKAVTTISQRPNSVLSAWAASPRGADYGPRLLWPRSGRILLVERVRTTTHRVLAAGFDEPVLGNTWWALKTSLTPNQEKALLLWLNSTPSILLMLLHRVTTEGAWMQVKQPQWAAMPVLDVRGLKAKTLAALAAAYDALCGRQLQALARLDADPVRAEIDGALSAALGLPDMKLLRQLLAREPGLTGVSLSPMPPEQDPAPRRATATPQKAAQARLI
jgi:hypothetical protein